MMHTGEKNSYITDLIKTEGYFQLLFLKNFTKRNTKTTYIILCMFI